MNELNLYLKAFVRLKQGITKYGKAPHKPVFLLTLIELIEKDLDHDNHFSFRTMVMSPMDLRYVPICTGLLIVDWLL
ncbi:MULTISPECIES: hypothetical protein [Sphingobacterium]|uniref:hypothetical protein n=1 Tax=Sphingobacterium TaxID=28453 RepID=UPI001050CFA5|nr:MULTISPECIES: hypothetical protein [Sphingobacterium]